MVRRVAQEHRDSTPAIIGSDTPVNLQDLMFADLRRGLGA